MDLRRVIPAPIRSAIRNALGGELLLSRPDDQPLPSTEIDGLRVECRKTSPDEPLIARWNELAQSAADATPFQCGTWQGGLIERFVLPGRLRLLVASRGGRVVGILPLRLNDDGGVETPGAEVSDYLEPLATPGEEAAFMAATLRLLRSLWDHRVKALSFNNLREAAAGAITSAGLAEGFVVERAEAVPSVVIDLPQTWDAYLESLDAHERKEVRRKVRKAQTQGDAKLRVVGGDAPDPLGDIEAALAMIEGNDPAKRDWIRQHVRPLLVGVGPAMVREGRMRLLSLVVKGAPAACLIELPDRDGPLMYNGGFDPAMKEWSPGAVMFAMAIERAIAGGARRFDLLRGQEAYKYRLGATDRALFRLTLRPA